MGAWDIQPWECDSASDWFGDLLDSTSFAKRVEATLLLSVEDQHEEIRAAASVLIMFGRTYIWPLDSLDRCLPLAIEKLELIAQLEIYAEVPELIEAISGEVALLQQRLEEPCGDAEKAASLWSTWL